MATTTKWRIGQTVTWVIITMEGRKTRSGVLWSVAHTPSQWWVQPADDPTRPVLVRRRGDDVYEVCGEGERARLAVLRGEYIREHGIFAVIDSSIDPDSLFPWVKWHCDPQCELAEGNEHYDYARHGYAFGYGCEKWEATEGNGERPWEPIDVAIKLTNGGEMPPELCERCITLAVSEAVSVAG